MTQGKAEEFLRRAIALSARAGLEFSSGGPFGAVVATSERIVAEGMNRVVASHDPTWHAEMEAIRLAAVTLQRFKLDDCTLYTSAEPCPMCLAAAYWAGIKSIVYASSVEDAQTYGAFDDSKIYQQLLLPKQQREITTTQMLRDDAVKVWKVYQTKADKIPY